MMKILRYILFPFVPIYFLVTWLRNKLYDIDIKVSKSYNFPVICVGNLSVGGTGKTPMIEYLIRLLKNDYHVATLSRGYKRDTKGFVLADGNSTAESLGDEPFQFYSKFNTDVNVVVDEDRQHGIETLKSKRPSVNVVLLDDAYQHRKVKAGLNILLTTYQNPYFNDIVLPTGNLREPKSGAKRANIIVVTKCPKVLNDKEKHDLHKKIKPESHQTVFYSWITYAEQLISTDSVLNINDLKDFTLVTGIANPKPLVKFLKGKGLSFEHSSFSDHHTFSQLEVDVLAKKELIITTEKDFMRLKKYKSLKNKLFYLPITINISDAVKFNNLIKDSVKQH